MYVKCKCQPKRVLPSSQMKSAHDSGRVEIWKPLIDLTATPDMARAQMGFLRQYTQRRDGKISQSRVVYLSM